MGCYFLRRSEKIMTQCSGWQSPGWSNPNLLVNWDFRNPVNQRGQTSYVGAGYGIDMWWLQHLSRLQIEDGYVTYSGMWELRQRFECPLVAGIYTLSIKAANCNGKTLFQCASAQNEVIVEIAIPEIGAEWEFKKITFYTGKSISRISFYNTGQEDATMDIQAVKLEVGSISTLALDLMQPSDYAAELRKCQRYLQVIKADGILELGNLHTYDIDAGYFSFPLICTMRIKPTLTGIENLIAIVGRYSTNSIAATGMDHRFYAEGWVSGFLQFNNANFALGENYPLALKEGTSLLISAEL